MSSADETHVAYYTYPGSDEGKFSFYFFGRVDSGDTAVEAFNYAEGTCSDQYPKIQDYSTYVWFDD